MTSKDGAVAAAKRAALDVLLHNARNTPTGLPRTAAWGYPEPYTRDLMICSLGILVTGNDELISGLRRVLASLASNQSPHGHIPGLADDPEDRGSSDTTPLFLVGLSLFRHVTGDHSFLEDAAQKALTWMEYQSPDDRVLVAQQPTSDWRDEQWVVGYGLFLNTLVYIYLRWFGLNDKAGIVRELVNGFTITAGVLHKHVHEGLRMETKPYYALWSYKVLSSERFDLLGNSLAILAGIPTRTRARSIVDWVEAECDGLRRAGLLGSGLPPNFFPYITPEDPDWRLRYDTFNQPGEYHNGGIWPFICGFYVAALVAAGRMRVARRNFDALTWLVRKSQRKDLEFGFNEWFRAQDEAPMGQDWQSWSAAMYLYAAACIERKNTPFFDDLRAGAPARVTPSSPRRKA
jgi:hypothetical protein